MEEMEIVKIDEEKFGERKDERIQFSRLKCGINWKMQSYKCFQLIIDEKIYLDEDI